jgi:hypothetical protein
MQSQSWALTKYVVGEFLLLFTFPVPAYNVIREAYKM